MSALVLVEQQIGDPFVDWEFAASLRAHQGALQQLHLQRQRRTTSFVSDKSSKTHRLVNAAALHK